MPYISKKYQNVFYLLIFLFANTYLSRTPSDFLIIAYLQSLLLLLLLFCLFLYIVMFWLLFGRIEMTSPNEHIWWNYFSFFFGFACFFCFLSVQKMNLNISSFFVLYSFLLVLLLPFRIATKYIFVLFYCSCDHSHQIS